MVRTQPYASSQRFDPARVLAMSTAVALHVLAAGLLLVPLSRTPSPMDQPRTEVRWVIPDIVVTTPPPPRQIAPVVAPVVPPAPALAPVQIEAPAVPVFAVEARISEPAAETAVSGIDAAPTGPATDVPASGVQLRYLRAPAPAYPAAALRAGQQGTVVLKVLVDVDGSPLRVDIERSSGHRSLDLAARIQVLRQWKFQPATDGGRAVQAVGLVPVDFSLQ